MFEFENARRQSQTELELIRSTLLIIQLYVAVHYVEGDVLYRCNTHNVFYCS